MNTFPIVVVDDEPDALLGVEMVLQSAGFENVVTCESADSMWETVKATGADCIILDLMMPTVSGEHVLEQLREEFPEYPVVMATGVNELATAVRCMRKGAHDYLLKPVEPERLISAVRHALEIRELQRSCESLSERLLSTDVTDAETFSKIVTTDPKMIAVFRYIEAVGRSSHPVLINGETGTGKELIAGAVHRVSRRKGEFVAVNIAGCDDNVFSDTLFGHVKGAFTGAEAVRNGLIEKAKGGTLFLDEIGDLSVASQVKLLRVLQEREYIPLGSDVACQSDVRVVAATSKTVTELESGGKFRHDLFYRLKTHHVTLPPLRERIDDIPVLVDHFLKAAAEEYGKNVPTVPKELFTLLKTWHFPGNIRELRAMVFDAVARHTGRMLSIGSFRENLGCVANGRNAGFHESEENSADETLLTFHERLPTFKEAEQLLLAEALKRAENNKSIAASLLGISRQAVAQRVKTMKTRS